MPSISLATSSKASATRSQANRENIQALQVRTLDAVEFNAVFSALLSGDHTAFRVAVGRLRPGYRSNFGGRRTANFVYLTATLDAAAWGAELSVGDGPGRIYRVEPTGPIEDDPNLTDKKFPGNPTRSYRTRQPLRVVEEIVGWEPHPPEVLQGMRDRLEELKRLGVEAIND